MGKKLISLLVLCLFASVTVFGQTLSVGLDNQSLYVTGRVVNGTEGVLNGNVFFVLYQGEMMLEVQRFPVNGLAVGGQKTVKAVFEPLAQQEVTAKGMFLSEGALMPLQDVTVVPIHGDTVAAISTEDTLNTEYMLVYNDTDQTLSAGILPTAPSAPQSWGVLSTDEQPKKVQVEVHDDPVIGDRTPKRRAAAQLAPLAVGDVRSFNTRDRVTGNTVAVSATLMAIGTQCEVWVQTTEMDQFTTAHAQQAMEEFDNTISPFITQNFSNMWGMWGGQKIKLFYYDITDGFGLNQLSYIAGTFMTADMAGSDLLMLHLDTYPSLVPGNYYVDKANATYNVDEGFGTIIHEAQHMANFGTFWYSSSDEYPYALPSGTWLDEAFSMAAEDLLYGEGGDRIAAMRDYEPARTAIRNGPSLIGWEGTLGDYSLSYLFGQYLREQTGDFPDGGTRVYKTLLDLMHETVYPGYTGNNNTLNDELARKSVMDIERTFAQMGFEKSFAQFVQEFYLAMQLKQPAGTYGFWDRPGFDAIDFPNLLPNGSPKQMLPYSAVLVKLYGPFTPSGADQDIQFIGINHAKN